MSIDRDALNRWLSERDYALVTREWLAKAFDYQCRLGNLTYRLDELRDIKRRAEEMAAHEPGFGGTVANYILYGPKNGGETHDDRRPEAADQPGPAEQLHE